MKPVFMKPCDVRLSFFSDYDIILTMDHMYVKAVAHCDEPSTRISIDFCPRQAAILSSKSTQN